MRVSSKRPSKLRKAPPKLFESPSTSSGDVESVLDMATTARDPCVRPNSTLSSDRGTGDNRNSERKRKIGVVGDNEIRSRRKVYPRMENPSDGTDKVIIDLTHESSTPTDNAQDTVYGISPRTVQNCEPTHGSIGEVHPRSLHNTPRHYIEKDMMLCGDPFAHYGDPQLMQERDSCSRALHLYNAAADPRTRSAAMESILDPRKRSGGNEQHYWGPVGTVGPSSVIDVPFICDYGYHVHIGNDCIVSRNCYFQDGGGISLGNCVTIGDRVSLLTIVRPQPAAGGSRSLFKVRPIWIEDHAWIGSGVSILPGVVIGKGAVVHSGSVVFKVRTTP